MRHTKPAAIRLSVAAFLLLSPAAFGQPSGPAPFELERLELNPNGQGSLVLGTGELLPAGGARLSLAGHYEKNPLSLYREGARLGAVVGDRVTGHLLAAWAPVRGLELGVQVPLVAWQRGDDLSSRGVPAPARSGLGTPLAQVRLGLLSQRQAPVNLALELGVGLPLGSAEALSRDGGVRLVPRVMLGRSLGGLYAAVEASALVRPAVVLGDAATVRDEVGNELRLGAVLATGGEGVRAEIAARGSLPLAARESSAVEMLAGVRVPWGRAAELYALGGPGFGAAPGTPAFRVLLGVAWGGRGGPAAPRVRDEDGDGLGDAEDKCPRVAGPASSHGCPVTDTDQDGIVDAHDACPTQAGPPTRLGCPAPSAAAPAARAVPTPGAVQDTDQDGLADERDECPREAGPASSQGCPAPRPPPSRPLRFVSLQEGKLELKEPVAFDKGKAVVLPSRSRELLDEVFQVLSEHPEIERLLIEAHTDNRGDAAANRELSLARAEAVKAYLVSKGVAAARLEARGLGPDQPIRSNLTESGRVANRRVEFTIASPGRGPK